MRVRSARSRNRAEAWSYDIGQRRAYRHAMAQSEAEREAIDRAYEAEVQAGPDFIGYHRDSDFAEPPRHRLDRNDVARILHAFEVVRRRLYKLRKSRGQAVSRNYREVLAVLLGFARRGQVYPSLATIARMASVCVRTVQHAIDWLVGYGFLDRIRRIARRQTLLGTRVVQTSNAYRVGALRLDALAALLEGSDGNHCDPVPLNRDYYERHMLVESAA